jgi:hypothetical protein
MTSNTDTVLLIIMTVFLSLFFLIGIIVLIALLRTIGNVKRVLYKAEDVIDTVESATEVLKDTQGRLALFKLISNIVKMVNKRSK